MKILVCGAGSIGQRHIKNLLQLGETVLAWRERTNLASNLASKFNIKVFTNIDEAIENSDGVVVSVSTNKHIDFALKVINQNKALFIEKPLSYNYDSIIPLLKKSSSNNIIEIGFQLRAHPNIIKLHELLTSSDYGPLYTFRASVGQRLDLWRPGTNYKESYSANSQMGGGALLDLTHEIDLINSIAGPMDWVYADLSNVSDLNINAEDLVNMVLRTENGAVGQIQLDMLSPLYRRQLELVFQKAVFNWDASKGILTRSTPEKMIIEHKVPENFDRNDMFLNQMQHFISRINGSDVKPLCSIHEAEEVQKIVEAAKKSNGDKKIYIRSIR